MAILFDHHIIPERFRGHRAFRGIDKQTFDIDSPANRIYLPADREDAAKLDVAPHPGRHVSSYIRAVCRRLNQIAEIESPDERMAKIRTLIDAMRVGFANGDLYTNVPIDKTREEVDRGIAKVLTDEKAYLSKYPDQLRAVRDLEERGRHAGMDHLIKWLLYLDNPERQKQLEELIRQNPDINITAGNKDLEGTRWNSRFAPTEDVFRLPPSAPANRSDFPALPGYSSPSLPSLNAPEGFRRIDPRFTGLREAFPETGQAERQFDQLPPSTAAPSDPLILQADPTTGAHLPYYDNALAGGSFVGQHPLTSLAGLTGAVAVGTAAAPAIPAWLAATIAALAVSRAASAHERDAGSTLGAATSGGGVFSVGAPAYNSYGNDSAEKAGSLPLAPQSAGASSRDQQAPPAITFADRFGNWPDAPAGTLLAGDVPEVPLASSAAAVAPAEVRRLTHANSSNAGSVFTSGSAPIPYLPSTEFSDRFGNWALPSADGRPPQVSRPTGVFADEPSYLIPPPIFGADDPRNPRNDAEEWFSRWIRPLFPPR